ncbi:hypothetical protein AAVH_03366 [Aphelenchoides avenae]|nr:hypothetical protein AAVH_03366 [Aphelenchus avenae]
MQSQDEKWTQRGGGVFTDDEEDMNHQKDSPEREEVCPAGSFGHRLSRFNRQASKTPVATTGHSCSEEKGKVGDEERSAPTGSGRKACSESSFVSDSRSKAYSQNSPGGSDNNNAAAGSPYVGRRRRFRKPFNAVRSSTMPLQESNAAFPPPPPGFVHRGSSRGSSVRSPGKFHTGQRINGPYGRKPHVAGHVAAVPRHTSVPPGCHKTRSPAKASIPGFPISRTVLKSHLPSVKNLCLMGSAVSDVVEIATDNTIEVKCSISELARVLNGYNYVSEKFELKGIHFEIPMADAFSQVDKTLWADCELVVHNCDFRALSADACATLLGQFTSKNIHLVGVVELPEPCQDLLERPTFKAAYCLKFSRNESGTAPAVKIDPEKLAQWLHSGGEVPRYVMLQSRQVSSLYDAIATFRKEHQQTKAQSQYLVDIYTTNCPQEYRVHTIQELEYASRQRINIRYDGFNNRMILKRYSTDRIDAKSFELQIRTFAGVPVPDRRAGARRRRGYRGRGHRAGRGRIVAPKKKYQMPRDA